MQKNWYAVYTKPDCEKKVALFFTKKKIESFCPMNCTKIQSFRRNKILQEPLFKSYVFVNITEKAIPLLTQADGVISLLYWLDKPAIISENEIAAIREFTNDYHSIELGRMQVNTNGLPRIIDSPAYSIDGKVFALKNKTVKVSLPSLGFMLIARMEDEGIFARETTLLQNNSFSQS